MERFLRPDKLNIDPTGNSASKEWEHWKRTFESFLSNFTKETAGMKIDILINHVSPTIFAYISECTTYEEALDILDKLFNKPKNVVYARYILATRRQKHDESIDTYMQVLKLLAKDCQFGKVDAETNKSDNIRDAFITGLNSSKIRQRLLENLTLSLDKAYDQARSLEMAEMNSQSYESSNLNAVQGSSKEEESSAASFFKRKCFFCGGRVHPRKDCPALDSTSASPDSLRKATVTAYVQGIRAQALIDTGSSISFMDEEFFNLCRLKKKPSNQRISMASTTLTSKVEGQTSVSAKIGDYEYKNLNLLIVKNLCADLIIGHDILHQHSSLEFSFGGLKEPIKVNVCSVAAATVPAVPLFSNVCPEIKPVAIKSRRHSEDDKEFIKEEVRKLLADGIIEESTSPWRAQVLITKNVNHKKRLVIDYSQTINRYTHLDAYPLPNIEELVSQISRYRIFSAIDLQSAYHQVPILLEERHFTAFEALGNLYQFLRIPFGVTNGVSSFQRTIDWVIRKEDLKGTFAYLDDITICGKTQLEHDKNLRNSWQLPRNMASLSTKKRNLPIENWEKVLNQALHCIRSLLCTATCCTPHERMFTHTRRSSNGVSIPTWLTESEKVLMRKFNRTNKYQPIVEEVTLLHVNPDYSYVRYEDGRETTVSNRHLAPLSLDSQIMVDETTNIEALNENSNEVEDPNPTSQNSETRSSDSENETEDIDHPEPPADTEPEIRRSARVRHPPAHLEDYFQG
ncbi:uncharacterized protein LOC113236663 [Hyposmocoma kahamanoa]|uniref:uncharacterized protein LOC113236663 n=1 Tax=Hyposmocoma kahamanoa TaxID=1477025 RepID=UPI000E6D7F8A|nr:uncharacterized protein LOC113236663 [Hyposmocoma kahamanoa]